jgi:hypothetical protein
MGHGAHLLRRQAESAGQHAQTGCDARHGQAAAVTARTWGCTAQSLRRQRTQQPGLAWPTPGPQAAQRNQSVSDARHQGCGLRSVRSGSARGLQVASGDSGRPAPRCARLCGVAQHAAVRRARRGMKHRLRLGGRAPPQSATAPASRTGRQRRAPADVAARASAYSAAGRQHRAAGGSRAQRCAPSPRLFNTLSHAAPRRLRAACRPHRPQSMR